MRRLVDASVAIKWYVPEIYEQEATRLQQSGDELHAAQLILPEFGHYLEKSFEAGNYRERRSKNSY